ncbi:WD repeat-containing protein 34 [Sorochytrium milnesiophthora]
MFTDVEPATTSFASTWRTRAHKSERISVEVQTRGIPQADVCEQSVETAAAQTQTDPERVKSASLSAQSLGVEALVDFLRSQEPHVSRTLIDNINSTAFDTWRDNEPGQDRTEQGKAGGEVKFLHALTPQALVEDELDVRPLCASWSKSGSTLAVSYGRVAHEAWCVHQGYICIWHLSSRRFSPIKPSLTLETTSCVTSLAFHPTQNQLLCAGSFAGTVFLWDCSADVNEGTGLLLAQSTMGPETHQEPVSSCQWVAGTVDTASATLARPADYQVLTCGLDGRVLLWTVQRQALVLTAKAQALVRHIPYSEKARPLSAQTQGASVRADSGSSSRGAGIPLGLTTCSAPLDALSTPALLLGTESGYVFHSVRSKLAAAGGTATPNPIQLMYESHLGEVSCVAFHPSMRGLFATAGLDDGQVRIHALFQKAPVLLLELPADTASASSVPSAMRSGVTALAWSPTHATVLIITRATHLLVYDLKVSLLFPTASTPLAELSTTAETFLSESGLAGSPRSNKKAAASRRAASSSPSGPAREAKARSGLVIRPGGRDVCILLGERGNDVGQRRGASAGAVVVAQLDQSADATLGPHIDDSATLRALFASSVFSHDASH